jgi:hypothetical protein
MEQSQHTPDISLKEELAQVRKRILSQLTFLVSAREYVFWRPVNKYSLVNAELESFYDLPSFLITDKLGFVNSCKLIRIFQQEGELHVEGCEEQSQIVTDTTEIDRLNTDMLLTVLELILAGEFVN